MNTAPLLLAGFEPFGGAAENPSQQVALALAGTHVAGHPVRALVLPTTFGGAVPALQAALARERPALVLCLGQAGGRAAVSIERVAINVVDARIADNAGAQPVDQPVAADGPAAYFSSLPIKAQHAALQAAGLPSEVSNTAGTFVCNQVFYALMHALREQPAVRGGFVHLPWLPGQGNPSLALEDMVRAVRVLLATALSRDRDIPLGAGRLD